MKIEIALGNKPLTLDPVVTDGAGAVARFDGLVRSTEGGEPISGLEYEAYAPMAEKIIRSILEDLGREHPFHLVRVRHRLGFVPVGGAAIIMDVHSRHRAEAFAVLTKFMDRLKRDVPIWKTGSVGQKGEGPLLPSKPANDDERGRPARERCNERGQDARAPLA